MKGIRAAGSRLGAALALAAGTLGCVPALPASLADLNGDHVVNVLDISWVSSCLGLDPAATPLCAAADVDASGGVDAADLDFVAGHFGWMACNGHEALCDRRYDAVAYPTTHNAFSAWYEGFFFLNQWNGVAQQLADGVRAFMLDTWYWEDGVYLCHADCNFGAKPLLEDLVALREFLEANPAEVVTLIFESYVSAADTRAVFEESRLLPYAYAHPAGAAWPTLRQMIDQGKRLVVLTDSGGGSYPWYHPLFSLAWETHFSNTFPSDFSCARNRGSSSNPLFILNHFLTQNTGAPNLARQVNFDPFFVERALQCREETGRQPNFVTVDFYDIGDLFDVVDVLNGV